MTLSALHRLAVALQIQLPQFPQQPASDSVPADTAFDPEIGRAAQRILSDSLHTIPEQFSLWARRAYVDFVQLLPRLAVAFVAAAVIIALTLWARNAAQRRTRDPEAPAGHGITVVGVLIAALVAAAITGFPSIAAALLTFALFYALAALVRTVGPRVLGRSSAAPEAIELALIVVRYALIVLGAVEALGALGLNVGGVIAGLGILGIAVGFAAQDTLANLVAGFAILWDRSLRVGDWVKIKDSEGRVRRITLRTTRIETRDEGIVVMPNKEIISSTILNFSLRNLTRVRVPVDVNYDADIHAARETLLSLVPEDDIVSTRPDPFVAVTNLGESAVTMELVFFITDPRELIPLRWRLLEQTLLTFRERGIEITYPQLNVHLRSVDPEKARVLTGDG